MDSLTSTERSARMSLIRSENMKPEMTVRRLVHGMGYRYRLHVATLPGKPDLVFPKRGKIIFVHGCFWHRHRSPKCKLARLPKSKLDFWGPKLESNSLRDIAVLRRLRRNHWRVMVVWECQIRGIGIADRIKRFLEAD